MPTNVTPRLRIFSVRLCKTRSIQLGQRTLRSQKTKSMTFADRRMSLKACDCPGNPASVKASTFRPSNSLLSFAADSAAIASEESCQVKNRQHQQAALPTEWPIASEASKEAEWLRRSSSWNELDRALYCPLAKNTSKFRTVAGSGIDLSPEVSRTWIEPHEHAVEFPTIERRTWDWSAS